LSFHATARRAVRCSCMTHEIPPRKSRTKNLHRSSHRRKRDAWHFLFTNLLYNVAPSGFEVLVEVLLSLEPSKADIVILRRGKKARRQGHLLQRLWPLLGQYTVLEYKSPVRSSFRRGDLIRLISYGTQYHSRHAKNLFNPDELTLVLVVASLTPTLFGEIERMGWTLEPMEGGYARIKGVMYPCYVVVINEVCQEERDDYLRAFSHHPVEDPEVLSFMSSWMKEKNMQLPRRRRLNLNDPKDRSELLRRMFEDSRLVEFEVERENLLLRMPIDMLGALATTDYLKTLSPDVRRNVQERLKEEGILVRNTKKKGGGKETKKVSPHPTRRSRKAA